MNTSEFPIHNDWPDLVKNAMIHIGDITRRTMIYIHAMSEAPFCSNESKHSSQLERLRNELDQEKEYSRILFSRIDKIPSKNRPYYSREARMKILEFKAIKGWNNKQTADAFGVTDSTISNWSVELDNHGEDSFVQIPVPVNKYPEFLDYVTQYLKSVCSQFGKKTIAEYFMRAGLYMAASTVGRRIRNRHFNKPDDPGKTPINIVESEDVQVVKSRHPNHTWMLDLTTIPTYNGFWTSLPPNALPQRWPFCYWVLIIIDHFSRKVIGFASFNSQPSAHQVIDALKKAIKLAGKNPEYIISDKGTQFHPPANAKDKNDHPYIKWCKKKKIKPRFGAVGKYGSIAIIERFMRSIKDECTRIISIPFNHDDFRKEISLYIFWYNQYRPHQYLDARTPQEAYDEFPAKPKLLVKQNSKLPEFELHISYLEGRKHLPVIEIKQAA